MYSLTLTLASFSQIYIAESQDDFDVVIALSRWKL